MASLTLVSLALAAQPISFRAQAQPAREACTDVHRDVSSPLTDLRDSAYIRMDGQATSYTGGLYPGGANLRPPAHEAAGQAIAATIVPLGSDGPPDPVQGRIAVVSLGMSNTQAEFQNFMDLVHRDLEVNPQVGVGQWGAGGAHGRPLG